MVSLKVVIIDDEHFACERLKKLLNSFTFITILDSFTNSKKGLDYIVNNQPDLIFLDVELENGMSAFDMIDKINFNHYRPFIVLVTAYPHYSIKAIKYEVFDYIQKPVDIDELKDTLERLKRHLSFNSTKLKEEYQMLSDREIEILKLILEGHKSEFIAKQLFISLNTVNTHRRNILKKTAAKSTFDLIRKRNKDHV